MIDAASDDYNYGNRIINEVIKGRVEAFANKATISENRLLVNQKSTDRIHAKKLAEYFELVKIVSQPDEPITICRDPEDNKLLESAVSSQADYLVTSDNDLLVIGELDGTKIISPGEFWNIYSSQSDASWKKWISDFLKP